MTTQPAVFPPNLISGPAVAKLAGWPQGKVTGILEFHGCLPAMEMPYGRGTLKFFDRAKVDTAIERYKAALQPKQEPAPLVSPPSKLTFDEIHERIDALEQTLQARDRILFAKLEAIATGINLLLDHITAPKDGTKEQQVAQLLVTEQAEPKAVAKTRPTVVVAGLLPGQAELINREFESRLRLKFYTSEHAATGGFGASIHAVDYVVLMVDFVKHKVEDATKQSGARMIRVAGGMTRLRATLREIADDALPKVP